MRRLYVRIYLAVLGSLALFAVLVGLSGWVFHEFEGAGRRPRPQPPFMIGCRRASSARPAPARSAGPGAASSGTAARNSVWRCWRPAGERHRAGRRYPGRRELAHWRSRAATKGVHWRGPWRRRDPPRRRAPARSRSSRRTGIRFLIPLRWLGLVFAIGLAVAAASYPLVRRLTRNLERLQQGVAAFGQGNLKTRVPVRGRDEVAKLAGTFNAAADQIEALVARAKAAARQRLARTALAAGAASDGGRDDRRQPPSPSRSRRKSRATSPNSTALVDEILLGQPPRRRNGRTPAPANASTSSGLLAEECAAFDANLTVAPGQSIIRRRRRPASAPAFLCLSSSLRLRVIRRRSILQGRPCASPHRFARDHLGRRSPPGSEFGTDAGDQFLQLFAHRAAAHLGARAMDDHGERVHRLAVDEDRI